MGGVGVEVVVFDLGRVLVRICDGWDHAARLAEVPGFVMPSEPEALRRLAAATHASETGRLGTEAFCAEVGAVLGIAAGAVRRASDLYIRGHYPLTVLLLQELRAKGVRTACLSNTNENHWRMMSELPYRLDLLGVRLASQVLGRRKPERACFEEAERRLGVSGGRILFFDDALENLAAAAELGWQTEHVPPGLEDPTELLRERLVARGIMAT
jgi:FMN phosphatase YigB (HAD superfamily)